MMFRRSKWLLFLLLLVLFIGFCAGVAAQRAGVPTQTKRALLSLRAERFLRTNHAPYEKPKSRPTSRAGDLGAEPNQPILILLDDKAGANGMGAYLTEILLTEGFNQFETAGLSHVTGVIPQAFDLVILTQATVSDDLAATICRYVADGGNLLVLRPDKKLAPILGLEPTSAVLRDRYIRLPTDSNLAQSLVNESIQFHGEADVYEPNGAKIVAFLYDQPNGPSSVPAVTIHSYGRGRAGCFVYDLAHSIARTRQGNPAVAGKDINGLAGFRPNDLFCGVLDPDRDWIPQADIHQHILSDVILRLTESRKPLPRWYCLPKASKALLIMTGDGCGSPRTDCFVQQANAVESFGGSMSFYLFFDGNPVVTPDLETALLGKGHSTSVHPVFASVPARAREAIRRDIASHVIRFGHWPRTIRTHELSWAGYTEQPRVYERNGIRMDLSYVSYLPGMDGYMTGSALPMRFVDPNGSIIDVYQQLTQFEDDVQMGTWNAQGLNSEEATKLSIDMLRQSIERFHEPIVMNIHPKHYATFSGAWTRNTMAYARDHGVPIWSADRWLTFWESREAAQFTGLTFRENVLSLNILGSGPRESLTLMVPSAPDYRQVRSLCIDGHPQPFSFRSVWGRTYAIVEVDVPPAKEIAVIAAYSDPALTHTTAATIPQSILSPVTRDTP